MLQCWENAIKKKFEKEKEKNPLHKKPIKTTK
jgi:hypothetical protein